MITGGRYDYETTGNFSIYRHYRAGRDEKALVLNVVNPRLGGVLIQGEKGTAKSTAVRALADLLPPRLCIKGCKFHDDPNDKSNWCDECHEKYDNAAPETEELPMKVVELPVSATEDRVVGTLDIEAAIKEGNVPLRPVSWQTPTGIFCM